MELKDHPDYPAMGIFAGYGECQPIPYEVKTGNDGKLYAVFASMHDRENFMEVDPFAFAGKYIASFGAYDNAVCIE